MKKTAGVEDLTLPLVKMPSTDDMSVAFLTDIEQIRFCAGPQGAAQKFENERYLELRTGLLYRVSHYDRLEKVSSPGIMAKLFLPPGYRARLLEMTVVKQMDFQQLQTELNDALRNTATYPELYTWVIKRSTGYSDLALGLSLAGIGNPFASSQS